MRAILAGRCVRRTAPRTTDIKAWAAQVIANPAAHHATEREAKVIGKLLAELSGGAR